MRRVVHERGHACARAVRYPVRVAEYEGIHDMLRCFRHAAREKTSGIVASMPRKQRRKR
ncbi:hypothetical protein PT2222_260024 [Paraburkholderia tropica]